MELISYSIFAVLSAISVMHIGWALGMAWPAKSCADLPAMVVGIPKGSPMPPAAATLVVAAGIFGLGMAALWGAGVFSLGALNSYCGWVLLAIAAIFALRGVATYLPFGPLQASVEPFRTLDRRYFAPLCLLLASGYLLIFSSL